ncbi:DUF6456 domain-containing protein [Paenirhodobacter populi]|uniref:Helix-turn-helix domain-containing protein n=1 Tax=Paenirhodobacter populi TaxID=2306993 RepID=A0A443J2V6_9RHOB|nr:DUF6456 domain-containing protein [Sinirhodobacter populi]RWR10790.1 helix-turn-helix domain-containing protein [Sinirhodobacter populi]RWR14807.1 helix-turn-helix domain-containing protein [Sinirhodobacter populi]
MTIRASVGTDLPGWLPDTTRIYLRHVEEGVPLRQLARAEGCHASTLLRWVRRVEERREDPLIDEALSRLGLAVPVDVSAGSPERETDMTAPIRAQAQTEAEDHLEQEAHRILRRLAEPGAVLVVGEGQDKAVVLRGTVRTAVTARETAQALALKDWIHLRHAGRVMSYGISAAGRAALKRQIEEEREDSGEEDTAFGGQHREWGEREVGSGAARRRMRANLAESPLGVLARRRDANGAPFLAPDLVAAGERLREDFELAQMGPRVAQNWERFLTGGDRGQYRPDQAGGQGGSERARERVAAALRDLGPGLGDMVLRCCCFLEGLEAAERRLGWSARSGKIVLRIALMRLKRHYDETYGGAAPLIG